MNRMSKCFYFLIIVLFLLSFTVKLQANNKTITGLFLNLPIGAAAAGMGEAYSSVARGISSLYWNPAGLSENKNKEIMFMHNDYIKDVTQEYIGYCHYIKKFKGSLAFDFNIVDNGNFDRTLIENATTYSAAGSFSAKDYVAGFTYSKTSEDAFRFGISVKYIKSKIADATASAFACDFGTLFLFDAAGYPLSLAFTLKNLGSDLRYDKMAEEIPLTFKAGISSDIILTKNISIVPALDYVHTKFEDYYFAIGAELNFYKNYSARLGYNDLYDAGDGLTLGFGAKFKKLGVDYAFVNYDDLKSTHRLSINYKF